MPFIAMEYLERGSLRPLVGRLGLAQVGGVLESVLGGLAESAAHPIELGDGHDVTEPAHPRRARLRQQRLDVLGG